MQTINPERIRRAHWIAARLVFLYGEMYLDYFDYMEGMIVDLERMERLKAKAERIGKTGGPQ